MNQNKLLITVKRNDITIDCKSKKKIEVHFSSFNLI